MAVIVKPNNIVDVLSSNDVMKIYTDNQLNIPPSSRIELTFDFHILISDTEKLAVSITDSLCGYGLLLSSFKNEEKFTLCIENTGLYTFILDTNTHIANLILEE